MLKNNVVSVLINLLISIVAVFLFYIGTPIEITFEMFLVVALFIYIISSYFFLNVDVERQLFSVILNCIIQYSLVIIILFINPDLFLYYNFVNPLGMAIVNLCITNFEHLAFVSLFLPIVVLLVPAVPSLLMYLILKLKNKFKKT